MSAKDKFDAKADQVKGRVEEAVGNTIDDRDLATQGRADQAEGHLKEATEKIKDAAGKVADTVKDVFNK